MIDNLVNQPLCTASDQDISGATTPDARPGSWR